MRNNVKKLMFVLILLLAVGFAAVSTTLIINGTANFGTNDNDFDVYFSGAILDTKEVSNEVISEDKLSITYTTKELVYKNDISTLEYEVTNASKNYDAEVSVVCTGETEDVSIVTSPLNQVIKATEIGTGIVTVTLNKTVTEEKTIEFTCTLTANATERENLGENDVAASQSYAISGIYVDESGNAIANANLVIYSETPHYVTTDETGYFIYNGLERGSHEMYYVNDTLENIKAMEKSEVIINATSSVNFTTSTEGDLTFENGTKIINKEIVTSNKYCSLLEGNEWEFNYTGSSEEFIVPCDGTYKLEVYGAQGGSLTGAKNLSGGYGGYSVGTKFFQSNSNIFITIGAQGKSVNVPTTGDTAWQYRHASGGLASYIATSNKVLADLASDTSAILIVAGAGGGAGGYGSYTGFRNSSAGGTGGGLTGGASGNNSGGTQTSGSGFGLITSSLAGQGYYSGYYSNYDFGGGGGSGYIGGVDNGTTENGVRSGNGYAKITLVSLN